MYIAEDFKNGKKSSKVAKKDWNSEFVECTLTAFDKAFLQDAKRDEAALFAWISSEVAEGYKLTVSLDKRSDCVSAFMTHPGEGHANSGLCLSARGLSAYDALFCLFYKHVTLLEGIWGSFKKQSSDESFWG